MRALLHDPKVLILDEPTTGLDPQTRSGMWQAISRFHDENKLTVILVTHYLEEMSDCDQISVVLKGNVRYTGDVDQFIKDHSETQLSITLNDLSAVQTVLKRLDGKYQYSKDLKDARLTVSIQDPSEMIDLLTEIKKIAQVKDFQVYHATLERAYLNLLDDEGVAIEGGKTNAGLN